MSGRRWPITPRLFNAKGQKLQLAITAPLLQIIATEEGMSALLIPDAAARGAHIMPLAQDLWQLILTPQPLLDRLPALESIPLLPAEGMSELQRTLDGIADLPWHSQVEGLHGNAELAPLAGHSFGAARLAGWPAGGQAGDSF